MVTESMTREEAQARARISALSEGVRVHLESESADVMVYSCHSTTRLNLVYTVTLRSPDLGIDDWLTKADTCTCTCIASSYGQPCKHVAAAWLMFEAQLDLWDIQANAAPPLSDKLEAELKDLF